MLAASPACAARAGPGSGCTPAPEMPAPSSRALDHCESCLLAPSFGGCSQNLSPKYFLFNSVSTKSKVQNCHASRYALCTYILTI